MAGLLGKQSIGGLLGGAGSWLSQTQTANPEFFQGLGAGLLSGNMAGGFAQGDDARRQRVEMERAEALRREAMAQDQSQFNATFGLQQDAASQRNALLGSEAQEKRLLNSSTAKWLEAQGAAPELVQMAQAGAGADAFRFFQAGQGGGAFDPDLIQRKNAAAAFGIDPNTPEGRSYILTGNLPNNDKGVTAGDRQAIREADDQVMSADNASITLKRALDLSPSAMTGATSGTRAFLANNLPDVMVPDFIASPDDARITTELDNTVTAGALEQMKSIFGGNPTEGERAILLEIQGSSSQPKAVREAIYKRALAAVERRKQFNSDRATELRGGTYYDAKRPAAGENAEPLPDPLGLR